ncbi:mechanosensitive ion channel [Pedobacter aquatilis]|uniref:mechanosensitive ion channel family protein n=1 Tax=Pedobacter aquatilis TaxID=351343 RepID=UPI0025B5C499|nr:mechanosensitive ion channel domain-containing protein [Pedobacter aquatilis]MDN3586248.1 mechanosensitive ion channel [Pedobacter aquatilis]
MRFKIIIQLIIFGATISFQIQAQEPTVTNVRTDSVKAIPDTLLFRIQSAQSAITEINAANKKGYSLQSFQRRINSITEDITPLKKAFGIKGEQIDTKSLMSYDLILKDADIRLKAISATLVKNSNELQGMSDQILRLSQDSLLKSDSGDQANKSLYSSQIADIRKRLQESGKLTGRNLDSVNRMLAASSALGIVVNDLRNQADESLKQSGKMAWSKQELYLWEAPLFNPQTAPTGNLIVAAYQGQQQILKYFINSTWDNRFLAILIALSFFIWVHRNFRSSKRAAIKRQIGELHYDYLRPYPILSTLIVLLSITPLFEPESPSLYMELISLLLLLSITVHLWRTLEKKQLRLWLLIIATYMMLILGNAAVDGAWPLRLVMVAINVFFIWIGLRLKKTVRFREFSKRHVRFALWTLIVLNSFSLLANVFGRVDMAKVMSVTGVIGLIQLIGLAVFLQIILDAFDLQMKISACNKGLFSRVNPEKSKAKIKKLFSFLCLALWIIVLFINMSIFGNLWDWSSIILSKQRTFGSIHFTFGNILFFIAIVYGAAKLQKSVPLLFGEEKITFDESSGHKSSKVALVRLIIIIIGVLLAVTASGLPMDKLTVVLGAFGVGIGLGMQNIVNNFVSGIILIFEKPFRIGDYVELADKKGKVRDIGIRSSKLLTPQGSEVIIPNGDLLSGRLVNWTLSNDYIKTELIFKVSADADLQVLKKLVEEVLSQNDAAVKKLTPEVLLNSVAAESMEIKILAWINSIYAEAEFKSVFLQQLLAKMQDEGIKIA